MSGRPDFATSAPSVAADQDERGFISRRRGAAQFPSEPDPWTRPEGRARRPFASQASTSKSALSPARQRISSSCHRARPTPGTGNGVDGRALTRQRVTAAVGCPKSVASVCRRQRRIAIPIAPLGNHRADVAPTARFGDMAAVLVGVWRGRLVLTVRPLVGSSLQRRYWRRARVSRPRMGVSCSATRGRRRSIFSSRRVSRACSSSGRSSSS